jgi:hypothetical protein
MARLPDEGVASARVNVSEDEKSFHIEGSAPQRPFPLPVRRNCRCESYTKFRFGDQSLAVAPANIAPRTDIERRPRAAGIHAEPERLRGAPLLISHRGRVRPPKTGLPPPTTPGSDPQKKNRVRPLARAAGDPFSVVLAQRGSMLSLSDCAGRPFLFPIGPAAPAENRFAAANDTGVRPQKKNRVRPLARRLPKTGLPRPTTPGSDPKRKTGSDPLGSRRSLERRPRAAGIHAERERLRGTHPSYAGLIPPAVYRLTGFRHRLLNSPLRCHINTGGAPGACCTHRQH